MLTNTTTIRSVAPDSRAEYLGLRALQFYVTARWCAIFLGWNRRPSQEATPRLKFIGPQTWAKSEIIWTHHGLVRDRYAWVSRETTLFKKDAKLPMVGFVRLHAHVDSVNRRDGMSKRCRITKLFLGSTQTQHTIKLRGPKACHEMNRIHICACARDITCEHRYYRWKASCSPNVMLVDCNFWN